MIRRVLAILCFAAAFATSSAAQTPPAAAPADPPSIKVGVLLFADYTVQQQPKIVDADGNTVTLSAFQITRSYINVTGTISKAIAFRITPDIVRETGVGSSLNGSYTFRLKYAYAQWNLDEVLNQGSFARFGMQPNPWIEFIDSVYRYRFQGQTFEDREAYLPSSDVGATFHYALPGNYGDVHTGFFNGETYQRAEVNDQKAFQVRGTLRPLPNHAVLNGLRLTGFYDHDAYVKDAERKRALLAVTYEHKYVNAAWQITDQKDQTSAAKPLTDGSGWSLWVTPKTTKGFEGLLRFDHLEPNDTINSRRERAIAGVAYWLPHQGNVSSAVLLDYEQVTTKDFTPGQPRQERIAVHGLVNF
jgi:hypothetical protein